jgi:hypothetical protein
MSTKLSLLQNGCVIWATAPLQEGSYKVTTTVLDTIFTKEMKVSLITTFDNLAVFGSGMVNGKAGRSDATMVVTDKYKVLTDAGYLIAVVGAEGYDVSASNDRV